MVTEFVINRSKQSLNLHLSSIIHSHTQTREYFSVAPLSIPLGVPDSIRERVRWGRSAVGRNISLDARKSFSAHHQTFICAPLFHSTHACILQPQSQHVWPCPSSPVCIYCTWCVCCLYHLCVTLLWCCWPHLHRGSQVGRREIKREKEDDRKTC